MSTTTTLATTRLTTKTWKLFAPGVTTIANERVEEPLRWRKPQRVGINGDLFHEDVPFEFIDRIFAVMALASQHTFQLLTKRPERMREYLNGLGADTPEFSTRWDVARRWLRSVLSSPQDRKTMGRWEYVGVMMAYQRFPLPNVHLGVSVEDQRAADERIPELLNTPAAVRFLSCEPLLGPLELERWLHDSDCWLARTGWEDGAEPAQQWWCICNEPREDHISWVIVGGESGGKARPFDIAWARSIVGQCRAAHVAVFVKQLGSNPVTACASHGVACGGHKWPWNENEAQARGKEPRPKLKDRKGGDMSEWPEDLRVREFPR